MTSRLHLRFAFATILLLAVVAVHAETESAALLEPFLGCWDDQFTINSDSTLLVTDTELVVSYAAGSPPLTFTVLPNYTTALETGADANFGGRVGVSVIASNDPDDQWSAGKFSDFDMMLERTAEGMERLLYCQIDYADESAAEASKPEGPPEIDYANSETGCNGYPWSEMRRSGGGRCKADGTDEAPAGEEETDMSDETSVASIIATPKDALAVLSLVCFGMLVL